MAKSLCTSTVAFRPGSHVTDSDSSPSVDVSTWNNSNTPPSSFDIHLKLDQPIDLTGHILSPFFAREFNYQGCRFHPVAHLMCYRYAVLHGLKTFANAIRKWAKPLTAFPTSRFQTPDWQVQCRFSTSRYIQSPVFNGHGFYLFVHAGSSDILVADWPRHSCPVLYLQTEHALLSFAPIPITVCAVSPILRSSAACLFLFLILTTDYLISTDCDNP